MLSGLAGGSGPPIVSTVDHGRQWMPPQLTPSGPETDEDSGPPEPCRVPAGLDPDGTPGVAIPGSNDTIVGTGRSPASTYVLVGAAYLVVSLILWWHVLPHPRTVTTCGCGDGALTLWVINWPAYALSHALNPFYSSKLFVPVGINMAPNSLGLGIAAAPATWLLGPVASLNLIDIVSPPLSALAMFWLLRRWVSWGPAAFVGGLFFGYSPFVLVSLALAHPNFGLLAPIPLIIGCLDDLLVRHRFRPRRVGIALGLLVAAEFFISVEVLLLLALFGLLAAVAVGVRSLVEGSARPRRAVTDATVPLATAAAIVIVLLAYPMWFFFAGPAHLVGRAWPDAPSGTVANTPGSLVNGFISDPLTSVMHLFGGYQGPTLPLLGYLGAGMIIVVVVGSVVWRSDPLVRFFGWTGLAAAVLSLGVGNGYWAPWRIFTHLPVLDNVVPVNISVIVDTCAAIVLAVIVGHTRQAVSVRGAALPTTQGVNNRRADIAGAVVAAVALVPIVVAWWPNLPMTVRPVVAPRWFSAVAPHLGGHVVVLPYPAALGGIQSSMAWQATEGTTFSMVGGGGPGIAPSRAGSEARGFDVLHRASLPLTPAPLPTAANLAAIRQALSGWGVTTVVVPDQPRLPSYDQGRSVAYAVGLFTAALGVAPELRAKAWVWNTRAARAPLPATSATFAACTGGAGPSADGPAVASCILQRR